MNRPVEILGHNHVPNRGCPVGKIIIPQKFRDTKGLSEKKLGGRNLRSCPIQFTRTVCRPSCKGSEKMKHVDPIPDYVQPKGITGVKGDSLMGAHIKQLAYDEANIWSNQVLSKEYIREESMSDISSTIDEAMDVLRHPHPITVRRGSSYIRGGQLSASTYLTHVRRKRKSQRATKRALLPTSISIRSLPRELEFSAQDDSSPSTGSSLASQLSVRSMPLLP